MSQPEWDTLSYHEKHRIREARAKRGRDAAPEMLALLKRVANAGDCWGCGMEDPGFRNPHLVLCIHDAARALIAKIHGENPHPTRETP